MNFDMNFEMSKKQMRDAFIMIAIFCLFLALGPIIFFMGLFVFFTLLGEYDQLFPPKEVSQELINAEEREEYKREKATRKE